MSRKAYEVLFVSINIPVRKYLVYYFYVVCVFSDSFLRCGFISYKKCIVLDIAVNMYKVSVKKSRFVWFTMELECKL